MEYLKPIDMLNQTIKKYQIALMGLGLLMAIFIVVVPPVVESGNPVIVTTDAGASLSQVSPWKLSVERLERFTKTYLGDRFEWTPESFEKKKTDLKVITSDHVYSKFKESFSAFESLAKVQGAKSYFILEDFGFSNSKKGIEVRITRVLRIKDVAAAIPLKILINYNETSVTNENPFGLVVTGVEETELAAKDGGH